LRNNPQGTRNPASDGNRSTGYFPAEKAFSANRSMTFDVGSVLNGAALKNTLGAEPANLAS
jgi:hypothetical protein